MQYWVVRHLKIFIVINKEGIVIRIFVLILSVNFLTACGLGGASLPQDHYYKLPALDISAQSEPHFNQLVIKPVKATGLYHDRAILYIEQEKPLELKRYHYNFWSETPANLLHNALYQGLSSSGLSQNISRDIKAVRPDYVIDSRVVRFERVIHRDNVTVQVALDISVRSGHDVSDQWTKRYSSQQELTTTAMHPSAEAFGRAVKDICEQLITDFLVKK